MPPAPPPYSELGLIGKLVFNISNLFFYGVIKDYMIGKGGEEFFYDFIGDRQFLFRNLKVIIPIFLYILYKINPDDFNRCVNNIKWDDNFNCGLHYPVLFKIDQLAAVSKQLYAFGEVKEEGKKVFVYENDPSLYRPLFHYIVVTVMMRSDKWQEAEEYMVDLIAVAGEKFPIYLSEQYKDILIKQNKYAQALKHLQALENCFEQEKIFHKLFLIRSEIEMLEQKLIKSKEIEQIIASNPPEAESMPEDLVPLVEALSLKGVDTEEATGFSMAAPSKDVKHDQEERVSTLQGVKLQEKSLPKLVIKEEKEEVPMKTKGQGTKSPELQQATALSHISQEASSVTQSYTLLTPVTQDELQFTENVAVTEYYKELCSKIGEKMEGASLDEVIKMIDDTLRHSGWNRIERGRLHWLKGWAYAELARGDDDRKKALKCYNDAFEYTLAKPKEKAKRPISILRDIKLIQAGCCYENSYEHSAISLACDIFSSCAHCYRDMGQPDKGAILSNLADRIKPWRIKRSIYRLTPTRIQPKIQMIYRKPAS